MRRSEPSRPSPSHASNGQGLDASALERADVQDRDTDGQGHVGVQVIARAAQIMRCLRDSNEGMRLADLAKQVGLPRSTTVRIAQALEREGLVTVTSDGRWHNGHELVRLATKTRGQLMIIARPFMERLAATVCETVDLAILSGGQVRFIDQVVSGRRLRTDSMIGELFPAYCTANGKALLAELPPRALDAALPAHLQRRTPHTITTRADLLDELKEIQMSGIAYDHEEHELEICAVGAVAKDPLGLFAAITIAAPASRFYDSEQRLAEALRHTIDDVNEALSA